MYLTCNQERMVQFRLGALSSITPMSLISQTDRQMVIEALEYYVQKLKDDNCTTADRKSVV